MHMVHRNIGRTSQKVGDQHHFFNKSALLFAIIMNQLEKEASTNGESIQNIQDYLKKANEEVIELREQLSKSQKDFQDLKGGMDNAHEQQQINCKL